MIRRRCSRFVAALAWFGPLLATIAAALPELARGDEIELLDGQVQVVTLTSVTPTGELVGEGVPAKLQVRDVRQLRRRSADPPAKSAPAPRPPQLDLVGGGQIRAPSLLLRDEQLTFRSADDAEWKWPLATVAGAWLAEQPAPPAYLANLAAAAADVDKFLLKSERPGEWESLEGLIESISAEQVTLAIGGDTRSVDRQLVGGVVFAAGGRPKPVAAQGELTLRDGARIPFQRWQLVNGKLEFTPLNAGPLVVAWDQVARLELRSPRLVFLSELDPARVDEPVGIAPRRPWRRDRSVNGQPLTLHGKSYARGLGVHAASRLEFELKGEFELFLARVGLDDLSGKGGDCVLAVLGDNGQPLWKERVQGSDAPRDVRVDVRNQRRLTLVVEPGEDLDLADHVNWADARLIRAAAPQP